MQNHGLRMNSNKIHELSTIQNTPNTSQLIEPICPNRPKDLEYY